MKVKIRNTILDPTIRGKENLEKFIAGKAVEWEAGVKMIVSNADAVDTGELVNSFYTEITPTGFLGISSSKHAIYHEFGTIKHFVPFYSKSGDPILADWGRRVLKLTPDEMHKMGGLMVELDELAMMRRSLAKL